jgi:hypothetical protein
LDIVAGNARKMIVTGCPALNSYPLFLAIYYYAWYNTILEIF